MHLFLKEHQNLTFINKKIDMLTDRKYMNVSVSYRLATFFLSRLV